MLLLVSSNKHLRKKIVPILHKFFQIIEQEEITPNLSSEASINLILKLNNDITKGYYVPYRHRWKLFKQNWTNQIQKYIKGINPSWPSGVHPRIGKLVYHSKYNQGNLPYSKNHVIILINAEKNKIQNPFLIKTLSKLRIEENFWNLIKETHTHLQYNIGGKLNYFPPRWETTWGCPLSSFLSSIV